MAEYPPEVRRAIKNTLAEGAPNLIAWAKKTGISDYTTLVRLVYYATYGSDRGYCAPAGSADQDWKRTGDLVNAFLRRPWPPLFQTGPEPCSSRNVKAPPDAPAFDITGRYYSTDPTKVYVINQAGTHVEGYVSEVLPRSWTAVPERKIGKLSGDLHGQEFYLVDREMRSKWYRIRKQDTTLQLRDLEKDDTETELKPMESRPTLFMEVSDQDSRTLSRTCAFARNSCRWMWARCAGSKTTSDG